MDNVDTIMENFELGLSRDGNVVLVDHKPGWDEAFIYESRRLQDALHDISMVIHHIGSTSIPSICAKPILDLLIEVSSLEDLDKNQPTFEKLGYIFKGEYGIEGRRYYVLYNNDQEKSFVHIHAFKEEDKEIRKHLVFRDYLIAFPQVALEYENLKKDLSKKMTRASYSEAKNEFIQKTLQTAYKWNRLRTTFDRDLKNVAVDPKGMHEHIQELESSLRDTMSALEKAQVLGEIGVWSLTLGNLDRAEAALLESLDLIDKNHLDVQKKMQQQIRLANVIQWKSDFKKSTAMFENIISECRANPELLGYLDFGLQHQGKNFFDQRKYSEALRCFEEALSLRQRRNAPQDQIESSVLAIESTKKALANK